ncbi:MAG TPA: hypothetical protein VFC65_06270 [Prolixibacteraceae bacterium]|nr:hypothetical protein [Prolixibacteraceae bacterium]
MKKVSLFLGFAFMASMVFAQNSATVNQTNDGNKANVTQSGPKNTAQVDQVGSSNFVTVDSKGTDNTATVVQNGSRNGDYGKPNWGFLKQDGNNNIATLKEGLLGGTVSNDNDGFIDQKGNGNTATMEIMGSNHNFVNHGITQIQNEATLGNTATIKQSSYNNDMDVRQEGSANVVNGTTQGSNDQFFVGQHGINNNATVSQIGDNNGEYASGFNIGTTGDTWNRITQTGSDNIGSVAQGSNNRFKMEQYGVTNTAKISQLGNNVVTTLQDGDLNIIAGYSSDVAEFAIGASMEAKQYGSDNKLYVSTAGSLTVNQGKLAQDGNHNTIKYIQTSTGSATLDQDGNSNLIWLNNTSAATASIDIDQTGDGNVVASFAGDVASGARSAATFAGASLTIDQKGAGSNLLNLNSAGADAVIDVMQDGTNNWASVNQSTVIVP